MDNDNIDNRFHPSGMEQQRQRDDNDTKERFSISGAKFWGRWTDNYNNDDNTEHAGRQISDQPHRQGETNFFENYTIKRESNYGGEFNINERSTPSNKKRANNDKDDDDHLDNPIFVGTLETHNTDSTNEGLIWENLPQRQPMGTWTRSKQQDFDDPNEDMQNIQVRGPEA